jgi:anti-sigma factor RsiW
MNEMRSWAVKPLPEQHLMPDAVVAFVDGELSHVARDRAARHIANCPLCAGDTAVQRQARTAVQSAEIPGASAGLLAALRNIPVDTELPTTHERLAMTEDGQLVSVQRPDARSALGGSVLGASAPLGTGSSVLSTSRSWHGRRAVQGAGVVAAGLMLGALAMVGPHVLGSPADPANEPVHGDGATAGAGVVQANFATPLGGDVRTANAIPETSSSPTTSVRPAAAPVGP